MVEEEIYSLLPTLMQPYAATTFDRAFPYYKDGLNVASRRVLYVMFKGNYFSVTKKSAKIVGEVIGDYHPHGDSSVYNVLVKMGENFNRNYPFVKPQGNFGNMNGDSAAAMRYTEARLSQFAQDVFDDPCKNEQAIDWQNNYSDDVKEPIYMSTRLPIVLINGFVGIGTGYRCAIPPHSLDDVVKMVRRYKENKDIPLSDFVDGIYPEFPTGGIITNKSEIESIYKGEKPTGSVKMKAEIEIDREKNSILIHSMPFNLMWHKVLKDIKTMVTDGKNLILSGIRAPAEKKKIVDGESYLEYELFCNKDANLVEIANELINKVLVNTYPIEFMLNYGKTVKSVTIKDIVAEWFSARAVSLNRKYESILTKLRMEKHINEGILKIYDHLDEIIDLFKTINELKEVISILVSRYGLTELQSKYIAERQLRQISQRSKEELIEKINRIDEQIKENMYYRNHIEDIIVEEAEAILTKYRRERRTIIPDESETSGNIEIMSGSILISRNQVSLFTINDITNSKILLNGLKSVKVNGRNVKEIIKAHEIEDKLEGILVFMRDNTARYYSVSEIGIINNWKSIDYVDEIIDAIPVYNYEEDKFIVFTSDNKLKVVSVNEFKNRFLSVVPSGDIKSVLRIDDMQDEIVLMNDKSHYLMFPHDSVPLLGRTASGVKTGFDDTDGLFTMFQTDSDNDTILVSSVNDNLDGYITPLSIMSLKICQRVNKPKILLTHNDKKIIGVSKINVGAKMTKCILIGKTTTLQLKINNFKTIGVPKPIGHNVLETIQVKVLG